MSDNGPEIKAKRMAISLETKIKILDLLATGKGATAVGKHFGLHEATIRTIKKNETAIRKSFNSGTNVSAKTSSYTRDIFIEKMEKALLMWIEDKSEKRIPVDGPTLKQTALSIYKGIKKVEPGTTYQSKQPFSASSGWLTGFLKRYSIHNIKIKEDAAFIDDLAANKIPQELGKIIADERHIPDQVWNVDKLGLLCKKNPKRTYVVKSQKSSSDFKLDDIEGLLSLNENEIIDLTLESQDDNSDIEDPLILNAIVIKEGLDMASNLANHFEKHDPDEKRVAKFQRKLKSLMSSYKELYNNLSRNKSHSALSTTEDGNTEIMSKDDIQNNCNGSRNIGISRKRMRLWSESGKT